MKKIVLIVTLLTISSLFVSSVDAQISLTETIPPTDQLQQISDFEYAFSAGEIKLGGAVIEIFKFSNPAESNRIYTVESITKDSPGTFKLETADCVDKVLAAGEFCTFTVTFEPLTLGLKSTNLTALLSYVSDGGGGSGGESIKVHLTASAIPPVEVNPASLTFSDVYVGASASDFLLVTNVLGGTLTFDEILLAEEAPEAGNFVLAPNSVQGCLGLTKEGSCLLFSEFSPVGIGTKTAEILFKVGENIVQKVPIQGIGLASEPLLSVSAEMYDFGKIELGKDNDDSIGLGNGGGKGLLQVSGYNTAGDDEGNFTVDFTSCVNTFAQEHGCSFSIMFEPKSLGKKSAILTFQTDAVNNDAVSVKLSGEGVPEQVLTIVGGVNYDAGITGLGVSKGKNFTLKNDTEVNYTLNPNALEFFDTTPQDEPNFSIDQSDCAGKELVPQETCTFEIIFEPQSLGTKTASIDVVESVGQTHVARLYATGECVDISPVAILAPDSVFDAGKVALELENVIKKKFTLENGAEYGVLVVSGASVVSELPEGGNFELIDNDNCLKSGRSYQPAENCDFYLQFKPLSEGIKSAKLEIATNDKPLAVGLSGEGCHVQLDPEQQVEKMIFVTPEKISANKVEVNKETLFDVIISNTGTLGLPLYIEEIRLVGESKADFAISEDTCSTNSLTNGQKCQLKIVFRPLTEGLKDAAIEILSSDSFRPLVTVYLKGDSFISSSQASKVDAGTDTDTDTDTSTTAEPSGTGTKSGGCSLIAGDR